MRYIPVGYKHAGDGEIIPEMDEEKYKTGQITAVHILSAVAATAEVRYHV